MSQSQLKAMAVALMKRQAFFVSEEELRGFAARGDHDVKGWYGDMNGDDARDLARLLVAIIDGLP